MIVLIFSEDEENVFHLQSPEHPRLAACDPSGARGTGMLTNADTLRTDGYFLCPRCGEPA